MLQSLQCLLFLCFPTAVSTAGSILYQYTVLYTAIYTILYTNQNTGLINHKEKKGDFLKQNKTKQWYIALTYKCVEARSKKKKITPIKDNVGFFFFFTLREDDILVHIKATVSLK